MNGDAGILFETNKKGSLLHELENYEDDFKKKVFAKKNSMKYTNFRHFKKLNAIITQM